MSKLLCMATNGAYVAACYGRSAFCERTMRAPAHLQIIIVAQTPKLVEMVCSTPIFHAVRQADG